MVRTCPRRPVARANLELDLGPEQGAVQAHVGALVVLVRARQQTDGVVHSLDHAFRGEGHKLAVSHGRAHPPNPEVLAGRDGLEVLEGVDVLYAVLVGDLGEPEAAHDGVAAAAVVRRASGWEGADGGDAEKDGQYDIDPQGDFHAGANNHNRLMRACVGVAGLK